MAAKSCDPESGIDSEISKGNMKLYFYAKTHKILSIGFCSNNGQDFWKNPIWPPIDGVSSDLDHFHIMNRVDTITSPYKI